MLLGDLDSESENRVRLESYFPWPVEVEDLRFGRNLGPAEPIQIRFQYVPSRCIIRETPCLLDLLDEDIYKLHEREVIEIERTGNIIDGLGKKVEVQSENSMLTYQTPHS